jgi:hypothetical protein
MRCEALNDLSAEHDVAGIHGRMATISYIAQAAGHTVHPKTYCRQCLQQFLFEPEVLIHAVLDFKIKLLKFCHHQKHCGETQIFSPAFNLLDSTKFQNILECARYFQTK